LPIAEVIYDPAASKAATNGTAAPACAPLRAGVQPLYNDLSKPDFKDDSEAETRNIVRENVDQLYGFDLD
jgi:hypothetical protein